jgi:chorismate-pyruvate lyase
MSSNKLDRVEVGRTMRLSMLPPLLRVLLVTDGTVTRTLEAYFDESIGVEVLSHTEMQSDRAYPQIGVKPGDGILKRSVILRGLVTHTAYTFAESIVVTDCIATELRRALIDGRRGIGELLAASRMETFREVLAVNRGKAASRAQHLGVRPEETVVTRRYRIFREGRAAIEIEEVFPEIAFGPDCARSHQAAEDLCLR